MRECIGKSVEEDVEKISDWDRHRVVVSLGRKKMERAREIDGAKSTSEFPFHISFFPVLRLLLLPLDVVVRNGGELCRLSKA